MKFTLVGAIIGTFFLSRTEGHGAMSFPATRNTVTSHYCPQCANGAGVCGGTGGQWPADENGSRELNSAYTTPLTQLVAGGMVEIEAFFTAAHQGHFVLEFCQNPGSTITENCFVPLERDPNDTRFGPYASAAPTIGFLPTNQCVLQFNSPKNPLRMRFKLPQGANTKHGVLRWFWQTGNSCDSSAYNSGGGVPSSVRTWTNKLGSQTCTAATTNLGVSCGTNCPTASCSGEQFRNCADVSVITGDPSTIVTSGNAHIDVDNGSSGGDGGNGNGGGNGLGSVTTTSTASTTKAGGGGSGGHLHWAQELAECQLTVQGVQPHWTPSCQEYCAEAIDDLFYFTWCATRGITDLTTCVLNVRTVACVRK